MTDVEHDARWNVPPGIAVEAVTLRHGSVELWVSGPPEAVDEYVRRYRERWPPPGYDTLVRYMSRRDAPIVRVWISRLLSAD